MNKVSVAQLYKLTRLEIFVWSVSRHFFVNLFMHSPERYLNGQITVTLLPKHLKRHQRLHFTPLRETMSRFHHFYMAVPALGVRWGAKDVIKINGQIVF